MERGLGNDSRLGQRPLLPVLVITRYFGSAAEILSQGWIVMNKILFCVPIIFLSIMQTYYAKPIRLAGRC